MHSDTVRGGIKDSFTMDSLINVLHIGPGEKTYAGIFLIDFAKRVITLTPISILTNN